MFSRQGESAEAKAYRRAAVGRDCLGSAGGSGIGVRMDLPTLRKVMPWVAVVSWMIAAWAASSSHESGRVILEVQPQHYNTMARYKQILEEEN